MAVRIRLKRLGRRNRAFWRICATDKRAARDGRVIEELGHYDPLAKNEEMVAVNRERLRHWLSVGAQPSKTVESLLWHIGIDGKGNEVPPRPWRKKKRPPPPPAAKRVAEEKAKAAAPQAAAPQEVTQPKETAEAPEPVAAEAAEPTEPEAAEPVAAEAAEPTEPEAPEPVAAEAAEPTEPEAAEPDTDEKEAEGQAPE